MNNASILIVGHAEGGTCTTYDLTVAAVAAAGGELRGMKRAGEVLNVHRYGNLVRFPHGVDTVADPGAWGTARLLLDRLRSGHIIKDVVNLPIVERYVRENPRAYRLLIVDRDPRDVLATRLKNGKQAPAEPIVEPFAKSRRLRELAAATPGAELVEFPGVVLDSTVLDAALGRFGFVHRQHFGESWLAECRERLAKVAAARARHAATIERLAAEAAGLETQK